MNLKTAKELKLGTLVRASFQPHSRHYGIVLTKEHVEEPHMAKQLGMQKEERYDLTVHWIGGIPPYLAHGHGNAARRPIVKHENWELMLFDLPVDS
jgi:hypothetical protein